MQIQATLIKVRFQKEDTKWGIFTATYTDDTNHKVTCSFTGILFSPQVGQDYMFEGDFENNPKYGEQFKFKSYLLVEAETADGAFALLTSGRFIGVGPKKAQAIVRAFGSKTLDTIRNHPEQLSAVPGIGDKLAAQIHASMPDIGVWEQLRMLLKDSTDAAISKIYEKYGEKSVDIIKDDPYRLIKDIDGYGFKRADVIAASVGITGNNPLRVQAAIYHCLDTEAEMSGHCFIYATNLQPLVAQLVDGVGVQDMADAIKELTKPNQGNMRVHVDNDGAIYLYRLWRAEVTVADTIKRLVDNRTPRLDITMDMVNDAANTIMYKTGICLDSAQKAAVYKALSNHICVITGGPGTGKTTIIRTIIQAIQDNGGDDIQIACMAPTGRAARRMYEATGYPANTIHRSLHYTNGGRHGTLPYDYIIVDEASMIDIQLAANLLAEVDEGMTHVIFLGDNDQLPPIGPGVMFRDLLFSHVAPTVFLHISHRMSGKIAENADKINNGIGVHGYSEDDTFRVIKANKEDGPEKAIQAYFDLVHEYGASEVALLSPTRKRGDGATDQLNKRIQEMLFPTRDPNQVFKAYDFFIGVGDRVMMTKNYVVEGHANGDTGTVSEVTQRYISVLFDGDALPCQMPIEDAKFLILAYAISIHKSQGSQYNGVVVIMTSEHAFMGERALLYTAATRAKSKLRLVCDARTVATAVGKIKQIVRNSKLKDRLIM